MFKKLIVSHALRRRVSWVIAAVLILPFIFFFHASSQQPSAGAAGEIFGKPVSWDLFQEHYRMTALRLESQLGEVPEALRPLLVQSTWDWLLLLEEAKRRKVRVSDEEVRRQIQGEPVFQENGQFNSMRYRELLARNGTSPQLFESRIRQQLMVETLIERVRSAVAVTEEDVRAAYAASREQVKAQVVVFQAASFKDQAANALTEADLAAFYDLQKNDLRIPETFSIEYAGVSREELASKTAVIDEELAAYHKEHQDAFTENGTVTPLEESRDRVRQALTDERVNKQLTALTLDLQEDRESRVPFDEIVKTRALIRRSAGPFSVGGAWDASAPDAAMLAATEELAEGELTDVLHGESGVHVARVTERRASRLPPLDEVRGALKERLVEQKSRELTHQAAEMFHRTLTQELEAGNTFEAVAAAGANLSVLTISFTRSQTIELLGPAPEVTEAVFATPLGGVTAPLPAPKGYAIFKPEARIPAEMAGFDAEAPVVREQVRMQRQGERWQEWIAELRRRAKLKSFVGEEPA